MSTKKTSAEESTQEIQTLEVRIPTDFRELLEKQLAELARKKKLADRRKIFLDKKESLENFLENLDMEAENGLEMATAKISFIIRTNYRDDEQFTIAIPDMVVNHVSRLIEDIDKAILKIETELMETII